MPDDGSTAPGGTDVGGARTGVADVGSFAAPSPEALLRAVHDAATDLASVRDRGVILQALVRRTRALLGADMAYLSLNDLAAGETWIHVTDGVRTRAYAEIRMPLGTGILGAVAAGGTSVHTDDYLADSDLNHLTHIDDVVAGEGVRAISGEPLRVDGHLVGALLVAHRTPVVMPPEGLAALRLLALQAAVALEQTRRAAEIAELRALADGTRHEAGRRAREAADAAALLALDARLLAAVETGGGCRAVLVELAAELGAPVALLDARGEVRAASSALPDPADLTGGGCLVERDRGRLVTPATGERVDPVLARGALAVGLALQVEHELAEAADRSVSTLLEDLLGDHLDDGPDGDRAARREVAEARALSHGVDLRAPATSLVVLVPAAERQRGVAALRPLVARGGLVSVHAGHVCLLCPTDGRAPDGALADRAVEALATSGVPALVGSAASAGRGAGPLQRAHAEAAQAARAAQVLGWRRGHADRARLGLAGLLLGGHDEQVVDALVEQQLGPALAYDAAHGTCLVETATAVLEEGSRTAAAARLFVHVNTVRQRAERLTELLGEGWDVPPRSLDVHAALRLHVLRRATTTSASG